MIPTQQHLDFLIEAGRESLEAGGNFIPVLTAESETGEVDVLFLAMSMHPFKALAHVAHQFVGKKLVRLSLTVDSYMVSGDLKEDLPLPGTPEEMFKAGDPRATEALNVVMVAVHLPAQQIHLPYVRQPDGTIVWGKIDERPAREVSGRMISALTVLLQLSNMSDEELAKIIQQSPVTPE